MKKLLIILTVLFTTNNLFSQNLEDKKQPALKNVQENIVFSKTEISFFSLKNFCIGLSDLCDMTSKEINQMEVQTPDILGNLWKQKFLNKFSIYHNQINASQEIVFIDFSNTEDVNSNVIIDLLVNCSGVKKINDTTFESNKVEIKLMDEGGLLMLQFNYPKKE